MFENTVLSNRNNICWHQHTGIAYNPVQLFRARFGKRIVFSAISNYVRSKRGAMKPWSLFNKINTNRWWSKRFPFLQVAIRLEDTVRICFSLDFLRWCHLLLTLWHYTGCLSFCWFLLAVHFVCQRYDERDFQIECQCKGQELSSIEETIFKVDSIARGCEKVEWTICPSHCLKCFIIINRLCSLFISKTISVADEFATIFDFILLFVFMWTLLTVCSSLLVLLGQLVEYSEEFHWIEFRFKITQFQRFSIPTLVWCRYGAARVDKHIFSDVLVVYLVIFVLRGWRTIDRWI